MILEIQKRQKSLPMRVLAAFVALTFGMSLIFPAGTAYAQMTPQVLNLPAPGTMVPMSPQFVPSMVKGITVYPENPLKFDFIVDTGDSDLTDQALKDESTKLIKYFLAALTVPEKELWVNLSPYEKDRIIPENFSYTAMGRDLLGQDYVLKQLSASLMYPEDEVGEKFWNRVYKKAHALFGTTDIPMNTFNKIWIVPEDAVVYEKDNNAFVVSSHLKVMLEEDYVALRHEMSSAESRALRGASSEDRGMDKVSDSETKVISGLSSEVVREVLIPEIEREVNQGKNFAKLRQIYNSVILAAWYKKNLKSSLLGQIYVDQNKLKGIELEDKDAKEQIYNQYVEAFKKGVYNFIKEEYDSATDEVIPRKYFSGGSQLDVTNHMRVLDQPIGALSRSDAALVASGAQNKGRGLRLEVDLVENADQAMSGSISEYIRSLEDPRKDGPDQAMEATKVRERLEKQLIPNDHIPTNQQVLYARGVDEAHLMVEQLYEMGVLDKFMPNIVIVDDQGNPLGVDATDFVLVNPNFRTDRRGPHERSYLDPDYEGFDRPKDVNAQVVAPTSALENFDYPTTIEDKPIRLPLAEVLHNNDDVPLYLYAVGEKVAHVIREFYRGGKKQLFPNERAYSEKTPKPTEENVKKDRFLALSQNMTPLLEYLKRNLENPTGVTITLSNDDLIKGNEENAEVAGEIINETDMEVTLKLLSNFQYYSQKEGQDALSLKNYLALPTNKKSKQSTITIKKADIKNIRRDSERDLIHHVINFGLTDLVGHEANEEWSIETLEITDRLVGELFKVLDATGTYAVFTGDHGNIEVVTDPLGRKDTSHTRNQVGLNVRAPKFNGTPAQSLELETPEESSLTQIYPTALQFSDIEVPEGKNSRSVLKNKNQDFQVNKQGRKQLVQIFFDGLGIPDPTDERSPYNKANIPNIKALFDLQKGGGRVDRLNAHREFVGTREPIGPTNLEVAEWIRNKQPAEVHLQVEDQYFANIFTTDVVKTEEQLQTKYEDGRHYKNFQSEEFKIVQSSAENVARMLEQDEFYKDKRFSIEGFRNGRLLLLFDEGQAGGSEQGHRAAGTGALEEDLAMPIKKIDDMIKDGSFFKENGPNKDVIAEIKRLNKEGREFRVDGFLQESGVHSSVTHMKAWIKLLKNSGVPSERVYFDLSVDGRDSANDMGWYYIGEIRDYLKELGEDGEPYGQIRLITPRSNHERDVSLFSRVEIAHNLRVTGQFPTGLIFDTDEREYPIGDFTLERGRQFIQYLKGAGLPIERKQGVERLEGLIERVDALAESREDLEDDIKQFRTEAVQALADAALVALPYNQPKKIDIGSRNSVIITIEGAKKRTFTLLPLGSVEMEPADNDRAQQLLKDLTKYLHTKKDGDVEKLYLSSSPNSAIASITYKEQDTYEVTNLSRDIQLFSDQALSATDEKAYASVVADTLHQVLSVSSASAGDFTKGGHGKPGYGVPSGAAIDGVHAIGREGNQGYYVDRTFLTDDKGRFKSGREVFLDEVESRRAFFQKRRERNRKPIKYIIKNGIGGQYTPFQAIAEVFQVVDVESGRIVGEHELGKNYEQLIVDVLKDLGADWSEVAVIVNSKSGATDEPILAFDHIFKAMLKNVASIKGVDGEAFANTTTRYLHDINFVNGRQVETQNLFKAFSFDTLVAELNAKDTRIDTDKTKEILGAVLGNMFFETANRPDVSRLSAFIQNSGLDKLLGEDAPGFGEMFDNVGGRWTADLHMMTFLARSGLHKEEVEHFAEIYWESRYEGITQVRAGTHTANELGNQILDGNYQRIALLLPDELFEFGRSMEQNFNESLWQEGAPSLAAIRQKNWSKQERHYKNDPETLVINLSNLNLGSKFNTFKLTTPDFRGNQKEVIVSEFARLFTTFYGMTYTIGNRLIARALDARGLKVEDINVNDLTNEATRELQQNLFLRQPYVELQKGFLADDFRRLQTAQREWEKSPQGISPIQRAQDEMIRKAERFETETNIPDLSRFTADISNVEKLKTAINRAMQLAQAQGRTFVPFLYIEGEKFIDLRDHLVNLGIEWVFQGSGDQHINLQKVLAQPDKFFPFIVSFTPDSNNIIQGFPTVFSEGYLSDISPHMVRDSFAQYTYKALVERGGAGVFSHMPDTPQARDMFKTAFDQAMQGFNDYDRFNSIYIGEFSEVFEARSTRNWGEDPGFLKIARPGTIEEGLGYDANLVLAREIALLTKIKADSKYAAAAARLPNIVRAGYLTEENLDQLRGDSKFSHRINSPYLITARAGGDESTSLYDLFGRVASEEYVIKFTRGLLEAVGQLHKSNIAHGELKAEEIFVNTETGYVTLIDLGLATIDGDPDFGYESIIKLGLQLASNEYIGPMVGENRKVRDALSVHAMIEKMMENISSSPLVRYFEEKVGAPDLRESVQEGVDDLTIQELSDWFEGAVELYEADQAIEAGEDRVLRIAPDSEDFTDSPKRTINYRHGIDIKVESDVDWDQLTIIKRGDDEYYLNLDGFDSIQFHDGELTMIGFDYTRGKIQINPAFPDSIPRIGIQRNGNTFTVYNYMTLKPIMVADVASIDESNRLRKYIMHSGAGEKSLDLSYRNGIILKPEGDKTWDKFMITRREGNRYEIKSPSFGGIEINPDEEKYFVIDYGVEQVFPEARARFTNAESTILSITRKEDNFTIAYQSQDKDLTVTDQAMVVVPVSTLAHSIGVSTEGIREAYLSNVDGKKLLGSLMEVTEQDAAETLALINPDDDQEALVIYEGDVSDPSSVSLSENFQGAISPNAKRLEIAIKELSQLIIDALDLGKFIEDIVQLETKGGTKVKRDQVLTVLQEIDLFQSAGIDDEAMEARKLQQLWPVDWPASTKRVSLNPLGESEEGSKITVPDGPHIRLKPQSSFEEDEIKIQRFGNEYHIKSPWFKDTRLDNRIWLPINQTREIAINYDEQRIVFERDEQGRIIHDGKKDSDSFKSVEIISIKRERHQITITNKSTQRSINVQVDQALEVKATDLDLEWIARKIMLSLRVVENAAKEPTLTEFVIQLEADTIGSHGIRDQLLDFSDALEKTFDQIAAGGEFISGLAVLRDHSISLDARTEAEVAMLVNAVLREFYRFTQPQPGVDKKHVLVNYFGPAPRLTSIDIKFRNGIAIKRQGTPLPDPWHQINIVYKTDDDDSRYYLQYKGSDYSEDRSLSEIADQTTVTLYLNQSQNIVQKVDNNALDKTVSITRDGETFTISHEGDDQTLPLEVTDQAITAVLKYNQKTNVFVDPESRKEMTTVSGFGNLQLRFYGDGVVYVKKLDRRRDGDTGLSVEMGGSIFVNDGPKDKTFALTGAENRYTVAEIKFLRTNQYEIISKTKGVVRLQIDQAIEGEVLSQEETDALLDQYQRLPDGLDTDVFVDYRVAEQRFLLVVPQNRHAMEINEIIFMNHPNKYINGIKANDAEYAELRGATVKELPPIKSNPRDSKDESFTLEAGQELEIDNRTFIRVRLRPFMTTEGDTLDLRTTLTIIEIDGKYMLVNGDESIRDIPLNDGENVVLDNSIPASLVPIVGPEAALNLTTSGIMITKEGESFKIIHNMYYPIIVVDQAMEGQELELYQHLDSLVERNQDKGFSIGHFSDGETRLIYAKIPRVSGALYDYITFEFDQKTRNIQRIRKRRYGSSVIPEIGNYQHSALLYNQEYWQTKQTRKKYDPDPILDISFSDDLKSLQLTVSKDNGALFRDLFGKRDNDSVPSEFARLTITDQAMEVDPIQQGRETFNKLFDTKLAFEKLVPVDSAYLEVAHKRAMLQSELLEWRRKNFSKDDTVIVKEEKVDGSITETPLYSLDFSQQGLEFPMTVPLLGADEISAEIDDDVDFNHTGFRDYLRSQDPVLRKALEAGASESLRDYMLSTVRDQLRELDIPDEMRTKLLHIGAVMWEAKYSLLVSYHSDTEATLYFDWLETPISPTENPTRSYSLWVNKSEIYKTEVTDQAMMVDMDGVLKDFYPSEEVDALKKLALNPHIVDVTLKGLNALVDAGLKDFAPEDLGVADPGLRDGPWLEDAFHAHLFAPKAEARNVERRFRINKELLEKLDTQEENILVALPNITNPTTFFHQHDKFSLPGHKVPSEDVVITNKTKTQWKKDTQPREEELYAKIERFGFDGQAYLGIIYVNQNPTGKYQLSDGRKVDLFFLPRTIEERFEFGKRIVGVGHTLPRTRPMKLLEDQKIAARKVQQEAEQKRQRDESTRGELPDRVEQFLTRPKSEPIIASLNGMGEFDWGNIPSLDDEGDDAKQQRIVNEIAEIITREEVDGKKEGNNKKKKAIQALVRSGPRTANDIFKNVSSILTDGVDIVSLFQPHVYDSTFARYEDYLNRAVEVGQKEDRPVILITEVAGLGLQEIRDGISDRDFEQFKREVLTGGSMKQANHFYDQAMRKYDRHEKERKVIPDLAKTYPLKINPTLEYNTAQQKLVDRHEKLQVALERVPRDVWLLKLKADILFGDLNKEKHNLNESEILSRLKQIKKLLYMYNEQRDKFYVEEFIPSLAKGKKNPVIINVRGAAHHTMISSLDAQPNVNTFSVTEYPGFKAGIQSPVHWLNYLAKRRESLTMTPDEEEFLSYEFRISQLSNRLGSDPKLPTLDEFMRQMELEVRQIVGDGLIDRLNETEIPESPYLQISGDQAMEATEHGEMRSIQSEDYDRIFNTFPEHLALRIIRKNLNLRKKSLSYSIDDALIKRLRVGNQKLTRIFNESRYDTDSDDNQSHFISEDKLSQLIEHKNSDEILPIGVVSLHLEDEFTKSPVTISIEPTDQGTKLRVAAATDVIARKVRRDLEAVLTDMLSESSDQAMSAEDSSILNQPLDDLIYVSRYMGAFGFSVWPRLFDTLEANGIKEIGQVVQLTEKDLLALGLEDVEIRALKTALHSNELKVKDSSDQAITAEDGDRVQILISSPIPTSFEYRNGITVKMVSSYDWDKVKIVKVMDRYEVRSEKLEKNLIFGDGEEIALSIDYVNDTISTKEGFPGFRFVRKGDTFLINGRTPDTQAQIIVTDHALEGDNLGGISLDPSLIDLQIKRDENGVPLPMPQQPIGDMKIEGFLPIIINITPVNIPLYLGLEEKNQEPLAETDTSDQLSLMK